MQTPEVTDASIRPVMTTDSSPRGKRRRRGLGFSSLDGENLQMLRYPCTAPAGYVSMRNMAHSEYGLPVGYRQKWTAARCRGQKSAERWQSVTPRMKQFALGTRRYA